MHWRRLRETPTHRAHRRRLSLCLHALAWRGWWLNVHITKRFSIEAWIERYIAKTTHTKLLLLLCVLLCFNPKHRPAAFKHVRSKTWSGLSLYCARFSLKSFQTFNHFFDRLVLWKTSSNRQKRHLCKELLHRRNFSCGATYNVDFVYHMYEL